ncbi:MAG: DUF3466 family protein [Glaciecola sp.]|nr:DUF3466 family protein [Glaciecola sp.]MDG1814777.1 DUF3466 family protein [Glaciecola sp.]
MKQADVFAKSPRVMRHKLSRTFISSALITSACFAPLATAATYEVEELTTNELAINVFARSIDNAGNALMVTQDLYNLPIDVSLIDFENETIIANLTDVDAAAAGNPNEADYNYLIGLIRYGANGNSLTSQQFALYQSFVNNGMTDIRVKGFDEETTATNGYTFGSETLANYIFDSNTIVGSGEGVFTTRSYTTEDETEINYVLNDFIRRGFVQLNGNTIALPPSELSLGGYSEAYSINQNLQVVGTSSVRMTEQLVEAIANCDDDEERGDIPLDVCYYNLILSGATTISMDRRATIWQLDAQGQIISTQTFPLPFTPEEVSETNTDTAFYNAALAINDEGIAVGETHTFYLDRELKFNSAAMFRDGETIELIDKEDYFPSTAKDINNNNIIIGTGSTQINGTTRTKFFTYDLDADELTFPVDFFPGSSSTARDINNNNMVVGEGEVEFDNASTRRKNAFIYDMNSQTFTNLNDLLECDSPYSIVGANAINDNNVILANALVNRQARNSAGELVIDSDGVAIMTDQIITVKLNPIANGAIDDCTTEDNTIPERVGASMSFSLGGLLLLTLFGKCVFWRRRQR